MRKRRVRVRRTAGLVLLVAFLFLLLELNRFLPGGWPGGGGEGGFRRWPVAVTDSLRVRPPEGVLPPLPVEGVRVVLRTSGGRTPDDASAAVDLPGAPAEAADPEGRAALRDPRLLQAGLVARGAGVEVRHGPADPTGGQDWIVHLPPESVPPPEAPGPVRLRVLAAEDDSPLAGAAVTVVTPDGSRVAAAGDDGTVVLEGLEQRTLVEVEAPGRRRASRWVSPRTREAVVLRLPQVPRLDVAFLDAATGALLEPTRLRVLSPGGEVLWERNRALGEPVPPTIEVDGNVEHALLEVWTPGHPVVRVPLAHLPPEVRIDGGRTFAVEARDMGSRRLPGGRLRAHYMPDVLGAAGGGTAEPLEVEVEAGTEVALPADAPARLLVEAAASAPQAIRVAPEDAAERAVRLEPGIPIDVQVLDAARAPVEGAAVVVLASADGLRVTRRGRTLADGRARIRDLPAGPVEIYAHADGTAWCVEAADVVRGMDPVTLVLEAGRVLRLVVETPLGLPLAGVRVHATSEDDEARDVVPPDAGPTRTREDGTLVLTDLPDRAYRLRLSLPGYRTATVDGLRPGPGIHFVTLVPAE